MYNSTGLVDDQFNALYERLKAAIRNSLKQEKTRCGFRQF